MRLRIVGNIQIVGTSYVVEGIHQHNSREPGAILGCGFHLGLVLLVDLSSPAIAWILPASERRSPEIYSWRAAEADGIATDGFPAAADSAGTEWTGPGNVCRCWKRAGPEACGCLAIPGATPAFRRATAHSRCASVRSPRAIRALANQVRAAESPPARAGVAVESCCARLLVTQKTKTGG